jgi:predicted nucleotidyltransferase
MRAADFVTERKKKKRKNRYFGGYWYPGYGYYGSGAYGGESGDSGGGGESVAEDQLPGKPVADAIQRVLPVAQEIWFHGSRATNQHRRNSDTDILVVVPDALVGDRYLGVVRILQKLSAQFDNYDIQPTKAGTNIHRIAQEEGKLLWSNKQDLTEAKTNNVVFIGNDTAIVGQEHGKRLQLSDSDAEQVRAIAQQHGAWYEGNGMDRELTAGIIDDYEGSWDDDLLSPAIKGYPAPFLYVLFSNIKENDTVEGKIGFDPESTIFDRILSTQPSANYFPDRKFDAETLEKFLRTVSEGDHDFVQMSQAPATENNVRKFFTLGERLMFPENWAEYPYRAGRVAKSVNDLRDRFLATRKRGVYVAGSDHLQAVQQFLDQPVSENFADGKIKGKSRPGRVKRSGASCAGSVTSLRAKAKRSGGERGKMYHWCANMKSGRKK